MGSTSIKLKQYCQLHQTMKWILTFVSLVLAEDYSCPDGKSKKSITIKKDESFNFDIAPGYGSKTRCGVTYKPQRRGKTKCTKIKFSCTTFDLPNKSGPPKCKKGDKLKVGKQFFCKTKSPEVESTKPIKLMFLSDKKDSSGAATCTIMCADTATAPPPTTTTGVDHEFTWTITGEPFAHCIAPGDTMKFNWSGTFHNVQSVDKDGYDNCSGFSNTQGVQGPYIFNGTTAGTYYFVCGVGTHCSSGQQKAIITVSSNC